LQSYQTHVRTLNRFNLCCGYG